jgi:hypothetical protein
VQKGIYPNPVRLKGSLPKWHHHKLDAKARHVGEAPPTGRTFRWRSLFEFHLNTLLFELDLDTLGDSQGRFV